jgi:hypothetical protein
MCIFYHGSLESCHKNAGVIKDRLETELIRTGTEYDSMNVCLTYGESPEE